MGIFISMGIIGGRIEEPKKRCSKDCPGRAMELQGAWRNFGYKNFLDCSSRELALTPSSREQCLYDRGSTNIGAQNAFVLCL